MLDGDWNDPQFLESLREAASRLTLREGEGGTVALQIKRVVTQVRQACERGQG